MLPRRQSNKNAIYSSFKPRKDRVQRSIEEFMRKLNITAENDARRIREYGNERSGVNIDLNEQKHRYSSANHQMCQSAIGLKAQHLRLKQIDAINNVNSDYQNNNIESDLNHTINNTSIPPSILIQAATYLNNPTNSSTIGGKYSSSKFHRKLSQCYNPKQTSR